MSSRKAQRYDDSSDSSDSSSDEPPPKRRVRKVVEPKKSDPKEPKTSAPRVRLPQAKRMQVIQDKEKGIEDPEYSCSKSSTGRWTVKRRKMPIDQSPHLDTTAGTPQLPLKVAVKLPEEAPKEVPQEKPKKEDLQISWINMQATVNDSLKRDLQTLSAKYERLAQKEEKRKK
jgi:hypothetical protein